MRASSTHPFSLALYGPRAGAGGGGEVAVAAAEDGKCVVAKATTSVSGFGRKDPGCVLRAPMHDRYVTYILISAQLHADDELRLVVARGAGGEEAAQQSERE